MTERAPGPGAPWSTVEEYLGLGQDVVFPLSTGSPRVEYVVSCGDIALNVELGSRQKLPGSPLPSIRMDRIASNGRRMARIRSTHPGLVRDFHDLISAVADRIVTRGRTLDQALDETIRAWSALLNRQRGLGTEARIGMIGELMVLNALGENPAHGWRTALDSWVGPHAEQHDFALPDHDLEVKTTGSEQRRHTIHGIGQLTPSPDRPVWLVSLQLTRGGAGGSTLTDCVAATRSRVAEHVPSLLPRFDARLAASGWSRNCPDDERWSLRSTPLILTVNESIPRLDEELLLALPPGLRARIDTVRYRIDVTGLPPSPCPPLAPHTICIP
ncbi:PD-(D/E)XK motif protein [Streptomyces sp. NPDC059637]|uniref:PD-(D/E)XK motif protein n=1 Tax=Streptomyces sp. NPDC059637 TaxID=3347752 RepID=UPI003679CDD2